MATWRFKIAKTVPWHLEILQTTFPPKPCPIELKLDGRHHSDTEIQNC